MMRRFIAVLCTCFVASALFAGSALAHNKHGQRYRLCGLDKQYLKMSIQGDLFEIIGGKAALAKTHKPAVVRLANRLITDHTKSLQQTAQLARRLGVAVPRSPSPTQIWALMVLRNFNGRAFDYWYSSGEVYDHLQDIDETTDEIKDGCNSAVRNDARTNLPVLQLHLRLAEEAVAASR